MIKASLMYPYSEGKGFDMNYYCEKHMPMVKQKLGSACKSIAVEQGIAGRTAHGFIWLSRGNSAKPWAGFGKWPRK